MGNQLKKLTTLTTNNNMFKSFASAIALLAIGAYASEHEKLTSAGVFYTKETYKYGRFVASMKASNAMGTGSAFFLYNLEDFYDDQDVLKTGTLWLLFLLLNKTKMDRHSIPK